MASMLKDHPALSKNIQFYLIVTNIFARQSYFDILAKI